MSIVVEHRQYMRVDDRLVVSWRPVDSSQLVAEDVRDLMLLSTNREINASIESISSHEPAIAQLLLQLNHKLDLLADARKPASYGPCLTRTNLSRAGIAFEWKGALPASTTLRISITLPPENKKATLVAEVVDCLAVGDSGRFKVRCSFPANQQDRLDAIERYIDYTLQMRAEHNRLVAPVNDDAFARRLPSDTVDPERYTRLLSYR